MRVTRVLTTFRSLFWHADAQDLQVDMDRHVNRAGEILQKAIDQGKTEEDLKLSRDALEHLLGVCWFLCCVLQRSRAALGSTLRTISNGCR